MYDELSMLPNMSATENQSKIMPQIKIRMTGTIYLVHAFLCPGLR